MFEEIEDLKLSLPVLTKYPYSYAVGSISDSFHLAKKQGFAYHTELAPPAGPKGPKGPLGLRRSYGSTKVVRVR